MRCGCRRGSGYELSTRDGLGFPFGIKDPAVDVQGSVTLFPG